VATLKPRRCAALAGALEQIGHQRPLGIGQVGVHAAGAVRASVGLGIAIALGRRTLCRGALTGAALRLQTLDTRCAQGLAHGHGVDLDARADEQLSRQLIQRTARPLADDGPQYRGVLGVQRGLATRPAGSLGCSALRHPSPHAELPRPRRNAWDIKFVYTL
jgi:hypothetical protein